MLSFEQGFSKPAQERERRNADSVCSGTKKDCMEGEGWQTRLVYGARLVLRKR